MPNNWRLKSCAPTADGQQIFELHTTIADGATLDTAGQITDAPTYGRRGDKVIWKAGCTAVSTLAQRTVAEGSYGEANLSADVTSAGVVDLTNVQVHSTDTD